MLGKTSQQPTPALDEDAERRSIRERRESIGRLAPGSAERIAAERVLALALNSLSMADTARSLEKSGGSEDGRQSPKPDVLDAIRSLMMAPVSGHRTRRKP